MPQDPTPTSRPPRSSRHQTTNLTCSSSGSPDTRTQDRAGPEGDRPTRETLNKPGLNRIGDDAVTARDKTADGTEHDPPAAAMTRTPARLSFGARP
jgi:hypothetical protein